MIPRSLTLIQVLSTVTTLLVITVISGASDQVFIDTAQVKIFGANQESHLGASSSEAGDVDDDGIADIVAGAPGSHNRSHNTGGNAYIIRGSAEIETEIDLKFPPSDSVVVLEGAIPGDQLGFSVSNAGDVNGDGIDDFIVGAPGAGGTDPEHPEHDTGRVYIVYGSADLPPTINVSSLGSAGITIVGGQEDGRFGAAVSGAGDFNDDGFGDVIIGAPFESHDGNGDAGTAYMLMGGPALPSWIELGVSQAGFALFKTGGSDHRVGSSVSDLEDFNGDGNSDIAISSMRFGDSANPASGRAWIIFGGSTPGGVTDLNALADAGLSGVTIHNPGANDEVGQSVSCAGDADADGDTELLITRSLDDHDPETIATVAYLVRGSSNPDEMIDLAQSHPMVTRYDTFFDNEEEGQSAHGTYDVTGDGVDDHILGIPRSVLLEVEKGIAHRVDGDQNLGDSQLLDLFQHNGRGYLGLGQDQKVGFSVASAGNLNDDRGNDLMIGAPGSKPFGRTEAGAVYVFLGHALRSPNQVHTEALGQTVSVSWNNRAVYDHVNLFRDGSLHATLPGDTESFTDENVAEGDHTYKVSGTRRTVTSVKKSSSIRVLDPADMLQCISHHREVTFTWMNQDTEYEAIDVYRDGNIIATLAGTAEMFIDADVSFGNHEYQLVERGDRTTTLPSSCSIIVLQPPYLAFCSVAPDPVTNENIVQLDWSNGPDTLYEEILIYRDGLLHQTLAGNAMSTTDTVDPGRYVYEIEALADDGRATSARASCEVDDPIAPDDLICSADVHNVTFTWNNTDNYDQIIIEFGPADGSSPPQEIALIPGTMQTYSTVVNDPGDYTVCVRGEKFVGNGESGRTCCTLSVPFPLGAVSCSSQGSTVSLGWSNGGDYDTIAVSRDGLLIATISGELETYTDEQVPFGDHVYTLRAKLRLGITAPESCGLRVLASPENMTCVGEADQVRITWDNPATAYTNIEVRRGDDLIETLSGDDTEYVDLGRSPGEYSYSLEGTHGSSRSDSSDCETVIPEPVNTLGTNLLEGTNALLTWAPTDTDVESVEIFRDGLAIAIVPASITSHIDPNLLPGTYNYCVRSRIGDNYSTDICKDAIVPIPPNSIACSVDSAVATIMWGNGEVYDTVILMRDGGTIVEFLDGGVTSYVDANPGPGPHMYTVSGRIGDFVSTDLSCVVTVPYPPSDLACSVSGGVDSVLTWMNTEPSTSIRVYRDGSLIDELDPTSAGYTDAGVAPATYDYCVINVFAHGDGEKTSASACCTLIVPAPPSDFSCLSVSGDVELAWTNNDAYEDLTLLKDGDVIAVLGGTDDSYTDPAAGPGSHTYTLSGSIEGNSSATVSCTEDVPAAINNPNATALASTVSLTWNHNGPGDEVDLTRDGAPLTTLPISQTSHEDAGLSPAQYEYCWTVRIG
ncbi:MAG: integrin alpha, partial [Planctomycetota bacterium]